MFQLFRRSRQQSLEEPIGVRLLLTGQFDQRAFMRAARADATITGTVGWTRRRSDASVEVVAYREDGLRDFLRRSGAWTESVADLKRKSEVSMEAKGAPGFRIRREVCVLSQKETEYYGSHAIDTESRQFPALHESGLLRNSSLDTVSRAQSFWLEHWGKRIDAAFHVAFESVTGRFDPRVIPHAEYRSIWKYFNPGEGVLRAYSNKLLFNSFLPPVSQPRIRIACIDGRFYDGSSASLASARDVEETLADVSFGVIKPYESDNGQGVERFKFLGSDSYGIGGDTLSMQRLLRKYRSNFIIQDVVAQHEDMAAPHPESLNTLRVVTFRWNGRPRHLMTFSRFGADGRINDNAGTGGQCVGVLPDGKFRDYALDEHAIVTHSHPTTGVRYDSLRNVPNYNAVLDLATALHSEIKYFDLLSWDFAIDPDGNPVLIECNFRGASWLYQLACGQPLFGDITEDVLELVSKRKSAFL